MLFRIYILVRGTIFFTFRHGHWDLIFTWYIKQNCSHSTCYLIRNFIGQNHKLLIPRFKYVRSIIENMLFRINILAVGTFFILPLGMGTIC